MFFTNAEARGDCGVISSYFLIIFRFMIFLRSIDSGTMRRVWRKSSAGMR